MNYEQAHQIAGALMDFFFGPAPAPAKKIPVIFEPVQEIRGIQFFYEDELTGAPKQGTSVVAIRPGQSHQEAVQKFLDRHPKYLSAMLLDNVLLTE